MKAIYFRIITLFLLVFLFSCSENKQAQLAKLKDQQKSINEQIQKLETELENEAGTVTVNSDKFKFIGVTEVQTSSFDHYIRVQGKLDGDQNAAVFAEVPGTIIAKYADVGKKVVKGQVLAQIDDQQYKSQLESLETQYDFASELFDKQQRLWDQKIGSEVQYLQAKTNKESLEQQIESLKLQIEKFKIKSPIDGTIEECNVRVGGVVSPDPRLAAYRVVAFNNIKITAEVSEAYSSKVKKGDKLVVSFPDINKDFDASIDFASKYINPVNRTFLIESHLSNGISDLKANMIAILQINDYHTEDAVVLPMNYIQTDAEGSYVFVVRPKDNFYAAYKKAVTIGISYNGMAEILEGVKAGDKIVSAGFQDLIDGEYVRF